LRIDHNNENRPALNLFYYTSINILSFFISFLMSLVVGIRYLNTSMKVKVEMKEVLRVIRSGEAHINLYKKHEHTADCDHTHDHDHDHEHEEHGLLHAHEL
jgi:ABC-type Zn2+ transport system substrate-binding protein/surface adhesin